MKLFSFMRLTHALTHALPTSDFSRPPVVQAELCRIRNENEELEGRCLGLEVLSQQRMEQLQQSNKELRRLQVS